MGEQHCGKSDLQLLLAEDVTFIKGHVRNPHRAVGPKKSVLHWAFFIACYKTTCKKCMAWTLFLNGNFICQLGKVQHALSQSLHVVSKAYLLC